MPNRAFRTRNATRQGTTLLEVLVVIVIFLVGILAVMEIFPRGFKILITTSRNSVSSALARDQIEQLTSAPDQMPEMILPIVPTPTGYAVNANYDIRNFSAVGNKIDNAGILYNGATALGPWQRFSGPNVVRRVIGEGKPIPAPRQVGSSSLYYGGALLLRFGPIDFDAADATSLVAYGNDMIPLNREPGPIENPQDGTFYILNPEGSGIQLSLPSGPVNFRYHYSVSAYVAVNGKVVKSDFLDMTIPVPSSIIDPVTGRYPNYIFSMAGGGAGQISNLLSVDTSTLRLQRQFAPIGNNVAFSNDPYEFKLLDSKLGLLLFNPIGNSVTFDKGTGREPLTARVNYNVYDWRVLRDEFRLSAISGPQQYKLSIGSLKVAGLTQEDGLTITPHPTLELAPSDGSIDLSPADQIHSDNLVIVDLETGGLVMERKPGDAANTPNPLVTVNKSNGIITFIDADKNTTNGTTGYILLADGTTAKVPLENRAMRALYRTNNDFAVQVLKAPPHYTVSTMPSPGLAQYFVGRSDLYYGAGAGVGVATRIYFPRMDAGRKVTIGRVNYFSGGQPKQLIGQDFLIQPPSQLDPQGAYVDLADVDAAATGFDYSSGAPVADVKGASVGVRVSWNPEYFTLGTNQDLNLQSLDTWGRSYRTSTNETYLDSGKVAR